MDFRRAFGQEEIAEWDALMDKLEGVNLDEGQDKVILEKSGCFTVKSMYRRLSSRWVVN